MAGSIRATAITSVDGDDRRLRRAAFSLAETLAGSEGPAVVFEVGTSDSVVPTLFATSEARELEAAISAEVPTCESAVRGRICLVKLGDGADSMAGFATLIAAVPTGPPVILALAPGCYRAIIEDVRCRPAAVHFLAPVRGDGIAPDLLEVARAEADELGMEVVEGSAEPPVPGIAKGVRGFLTRLVGHRPSKSGDPGWERAQVTPLALGAAFLIVVATTVLIVLAGALTGKARAQRASDLAAMASARSMRDDLPRLLAPPTLPNGMPNPAHLPRPRYLGRARLAAIRTAVGNGASPTGTAISFPDAGSPVPVRTVVRVPVGLAGRRTSVSVAEARLSVAGAITGLPVATGGGYSGPLAVRQGKGMRPDVALAFDRLLMAARRAGVTVTVTSGYRSDAEQAALFRANPNPRWVAPPGKSLHRCGTELDLGPSSAYGWLAANAPRFGFVKRYSWEPWHFGYTGGAAPCSSAAPFARRSSVRERGTGSSLPDFVPARFRAPILRSAMRWNVSPRLLSAQLLAESNFDPRAVSTAGALGIAQFMPATAASYGLSDPFDPVASINAQARMMAGLIARFRSVPLALAAYNAGPGVVGSCNCVPPYPETKAYLARIMALLDGSGSLAGTPFEIELVR